MSHCVSHSIGRWSPGVKATRNSAQPQLSVQGKAKNAFWHLYGPYLKLGIGLTFTFPVLGMVNVPYMDLHWMIQWLGHYLGKSEKETLIMGLVYPVFWKLLCSKSQSVRSRRTQPLLTWATSISLSLALEAPFQVSRCNFSAPILKFLSFYIKVFVNAFISNLESLFHFLPQFIVGSNKAGSWFFFLVLSSFSCSCLWTDSLLPSLIQSFCLWKKQRAKLIILLGS